MHHVSADVRAPESPDVAFSFLAQDESLAKRLADRIRQQVRTFVYSEAQKEIAGKDGVEVFTHVFEKSAQFVVVLYRDGYGGTKWTRIEETAIKSRILEIGAHTVFLISLDGKKPAWLPASRLYYGLEQFGEATAADAILGRFGELGLVPRPETLIEKAQRLADDVQGKARAQMWRQSDKAVSETRADLEKLREILAARVRGLPSTFNARLVLEDSTWFSSQVQINGARVSFTWIPTARNSLESAELQIHEYTLVRRTGPISRTTWATDHRHSAEPHLEFRSGLLVWRMAKPRDHDYSAEELADYFLERLLTRFGGREINHTGYTDDDE